MTTTLTGNVLYSDATGALATTMVRVLAIFWVADQTGNKDIAADDDFFLSSQTGMRIIGKMASFAGDDLGVVFGLPGVPFDGLTITTMGGGVCYVVID